MSYAKDKEIVFGYSIPGATSYACQDNQSWNGVPFCAKNRTSRIEAAAMLLRQAGLWDDAINSTSFTRKRTFKDVDPYWYGYAQKGADIGILTPDSDGTLRPNEYVTKREFVKMAAIIYSLNMCDAKGMGTNGLSSSLSDARDAISSKIRVLDSAASCSVSAKDAVPSGASSYNFYGLPTTEGATYSWQFVPADASGATVTAEGQCVPKEALASGRWIARLTVTSPDGKTSVSYSEVSYADKSLSVTISADPLSVPAGVPVNFSSEIAGGK